MIIDPLIKFIYLVSPLVAGFFFLFLVQFKANCQSLDIN